MTDKLGQPA